MLQASIKAAMVKATRMGRGFIFSLLETKDWIGSSAGSLPGAGEKAGEPWQRTYLQTTLNSASPTVLPGLVTINWTLAYPVLLMLKVSANE
jgi:hypothetical protein